MTGAPDSLFVLRYGVEWAPIKAGTGWVKRPDWMIEKECLKAGPKHIAKIPGHLGKAGHYQRFISAIWGDKDGVFYFEWNPNAAEILDRYLAHKILGIAGCASSGKTEAMAVIAVTEFLLDPFNTKVLLTSITQKSAKGKIWGSVTECWQQACRFFGGEQNLPGRLMSNNIIRYNYNNVVTEKAGLELVPGEQAQSKDSADKIQGAKRTNLILMGDEWATLGRAIHETALSNLRANPNAKLIAGFNPDSYFDPGGLIAKPVGGWESVDVNMDGWATEVGGWCIHFDGERSPNVVAGRPVWRGLLDLNMLDEMTRAYGKGTKAYYKMVRGFWSPTGDRDSVYTEADILSYHGDHQVDTWMDTPVKVLSLDPAFAHGGDRAIATLAKVGVAADPATGEVRKVCEKIKHYCLAEDMARKGVSRSEQIVAQFKTIKEQENVDVKNIGVDATGGGDPFCALLAREIGTGFLMVQFKGRPSDKPVSRNDRRKGTDRFKDKVSELWYVGRELIRTGQIRGLDPDTISELCSRTYKEIGQVVQVESKRDMKLRIRKSPDLGDSWAIALEIARQRHGLSSTEKAAQKPKVAKTQSHIFQGLVSFGDKKQTFHEEQAAHSVRGGGWGYDESEKFSLP